MLGVGIAPFRFGFMTLVAVCVASLLVPMARGQVKDLTPSYVVVSRDKADMRCGETANHYKVMDLSAGTLLTMDGEAGEWARVSYPANGTALVRAEHVRYDEVAGTVTINDPNRLQALNVLVGINGSWKALLATPLPAGTVLKVTSPAKDDQGRVVAYNVVPPASARGFVRRADVRPATPAEVQSLKPATPTGSKEPQKEAPAPGKTNDAPRPAAGPGDTKDAADKAAPTTNPATQAPAPETDPKTEPKTEPAKDANSLVEPMVRPGETPPPVPAGSQGQPEAQPAQPQPETTAQGTDAASPTATSDGAPKTGDEPAKPAQPTLMDLERTFETIRRQSPNEAEYQALIDEFRRFQNALTPEQSRLRNQIQGRIDWMQMKLDVVDYQRKLEEMKRNADSQSRDVGAKLAELERQRQYAIVGRLLPSTVYDGTNLPLMYRLQSVTGGVVPRTIGYIKPDPALDLPTKLNQVVGIIGEVKMDPGMTLNVITAQRVDILQSTDGGPVRNP